MTNSNTKRETNFAVKLTPCGFKENTYIARVPQKIVTTDQLLDLVIAHNVGLDRYQVLHAMELVKKEILEQAKLGFAVDIMEICKLYIAPKHGVHSLNPEAETVSGFEARFVVNDEIKESLKSLSAAVTSVVESSPLISHIENPLDGSLDSNLKFSFGARITGKKIKVGGEKSGIFFIPVSDDGSAIENEEEWLRVEDEFITKNADQTLEFYLPRSVVAGNKYFIAVRTAIRSGKELKNAVTGISPVSIEIVG